MGAEGELSRLRRASPSSPRPACQLSSWDSSRELPSGRARFAIRTANDHGRRRKSGTPHPHRGQWWPKSPIAGGLHYRDQNPRWRQRCLDAQAAGAPVSSRPCGFLRQGVSVQVHARGSVRTSARGEWSGPLCFKKKMVGSTTPRSVCAMGEPGKRRSG